MTRPLHALEFRLGVVLLLLFCRSGSITDAETLTSSPFLATNIVELRKAVALGSGRTCVYNLEGTLLGVNRDSGTLLFRDASGDAALNVKSVGVELRAGQRIRICGTNYVSCTDIGLGLGTSPVVDADGQHSMIERQGTVFLEAGWHPIQVNWFNWLGPAALKVAWSGPSLSKQAIPDQALWQIKAASGGASAREFQGLKYRCFEGQWDSLPDFDRLRQNKAGVVSNFDINVRTRLDNVGLEFLGFLEVAHGGNYTFYLDSDDGGQLFLCFLPPSITVLGSGTLPVPTAITAGQPLSGSRNSVWSEVEGTVGFLSSDNEGVKFELASEGNRMCVEIPAASREIPEYLLHSRVRVRGICLEVRHDDGQKYAGLIVVSGWPDVQVLDVPLEQWSAFRDATISGLSNSIMAGGSNEIVHLRGRLCVDPVTKSLRLEDGTGSAPINPFNGFPVKTGSTVECLSRWTWNGTNILLDQAVCRNDSNEQSIATNSLPVLTTALQVQQLTREEAQREYPVEIHGVVIHVSDDFKGLVIQDSTRAVFVWVGDGWPQSLPRTGDYCRIEGVTRGGDFSPIVVLRQATILDRGQLPQPIHPTHDQLISGSLDAQYVELRGLVSAIHADYITLLTSDGTFNLNITPAPSEPWERLLDSIIRIRGCWFANWDPNTHQVIAGEPINLRTATLTIDSLPPNDMFHTTKVQVKELMQFNARFDPFRWVKVSGQIVHHGPDMYYLVDGTNGLRFRLAQPHSFEPGDDVEVVGLVELGAGAPLLRQAVARKVGRSALSVPRSLDLHSLNDNYDSTRVWVEGTLVDVKEYGGEQVLAIQVGVKQCVARLDFTMPAGMLWQIGSQLKLTGVFNVLSGNPLTGQGVSSFELLLNSPADVQVLARPPWWTEGRLLRLASLLVLCLTLASIWIFLLRQQVDRRSQQLRHEIGRRAVEQERSRIARDLHDQLGSELTEIGMLASAVPSMKIKPDIATQRLDEIAEKSRSMVAALDGVVWVTNPKNDTLSSLVRYLANSAEEFLTKAGIACRVELPTTQIERMIAAEIRHDVLLAVREVLNNAVRHGHPNEVLLQFVASQDNLEILLKDDGCGFKPDNNSRGNGLLNVEERMRKLEGQCMIQSSPNEGTSVVLKLPLPGACPK